MFGWNGIIHLTGLKILMISMQIMVTRARIPVHKLLLMCGKEMVNSNTHQ